MNEKIVKDEILPTILRWIPADVGARLMEAQHRAHAWTGALVREDNTADEAGDLDLDYNGYKGFALAWATRIPPDGEEFSCLLSVFSEKVPPHPGAMKEACLKLVLPDYSATMPLSEFKTGLAGCLYGFVMCTLMAEQLEGKYTRHKTV